MSTSQFPALLRRSTFASHDPYISRVYASSPSSIHQHGDWGHKYPIHRSKGPKYVKLDKMDAGKVLGSDWRSAEREVRFMQAWGRGRQSWVTENDYPAYRTKSNGMEWGLGSGFGDSFSYPPSEASSREVEVMDDVNSMTPKEFEIYLKRVRRKREGYMKEKWGRMRVATQEKLALPEDKTLVTLGTKGYSTATDAATFQVGMTKTDLEFSDKLNSQPHRLHGLSYSRLPSSSSSFNPILHHPGRALDRVAYGTAQSQSARVLSRSDGTNRPWVIGLGGVTASTRSTQGRITDAPTIDHGVDYTRAQPSRGETKFAVQSATLIEPPNVIGIRQQAASRRLLSQGRESGARLPSPMDTFTFDIQVDPASDPSDPDAAGVVYGSREWVGREPKINKYLRNEGDELGKVGGPRSERVQGEGLRQAKSREQQGLAEREARARTAATVTNLLARLAGKQG